MLTSIIVHASLHALANWKQILLKTKTKTILYRYMQGISKMVSLKTFIGQKKHKMQHHLMTNTRLSG